MHPVFFDGWREHLPGEGTSRKNIRQPWSTRKGPKENKCPSPKPQNESLVGRHGLPPAPPGGRKSPSLSRHKSDLLWSQQIHPSELLWRNQLFWNSVALFLLGIEKRWPGLRCPARALLNVRTSVRENQRGLHASILSFSYALHRKVALSHSTRAPGQYESTSKVLHLTEGTQELGNALGKHERSFRSSLRSQGRDFLYVLTSASDLIHEDLWFTLLVQCQYTREIEISVLMQYLGSKSA